MAIKVYTDDIVATCNGFHSSGTICNGFHSSGAIQQLAAICNGFHSSGTIIAISRHMQ